MRENQPYSELICDYDVEAEVRDEDLYFEERSGKIKIERLHIKSERYQRTLQKRAGEYVSLHFEDVCSMSVEDEDALIDAFAGEFERLLGKVKICLVAGIGNGDFIADSVGKRTIKKIREGERLKVMSADPSEHTGIESADLILSVARSVGADAVIAVDSVLTKSAERLFCTLQISDAGLAPGSALGAIKKPLNKEALGIPTLAVGVPVVIDSHSMIRDALWALEVDESRAEKYVLNQKRLFLTPHGIELGVERLSYVIARGIERALA